MKTLFFPLFILSAIIASAQNLRVFNFDNSNFPIIKANFFIYQNNKIEEAYYPEDFRIISNNNQSVIRSFKYSNYYYNSPLNSYFYFDINKTDRNDLSLAKYAAKFWIDVLQKPNYKTSLNAYFDNFVILSDLSDSKEFALKQINKLNYSTNYSLSNPFKVLAYESFKFFGFDKQQNILIYFVNNDRVLKLDSTFATDLVSKKIKLYVIGISCRINERLQKYALENNGKFYENIDNEEKVESVLFEIANIANNHELPEISWEMTPNCSNPQTFNVSNIKINKNVSFIKNFELNNLVHLLASDSSIDFGVYTSGIEAKRTIKLTAVNSNIDVDNISIPNNTFSVYPQKFSLKNGESINITVSHLAFQDSNYHFSKLNFQSKSCNMPNVYVRAQSQKGIDPKLSTVIFTSPKTNDILYNYKENYAFLQGVLESDTIRIDYSYDNGITWNILNKNHVGRRVDLRNLPNINSKEFLLRAQMVIKPENLPYSEIYTHDQAFQITSFAQSPDNRIFITAATNGEVLVWDAQKATFIKKLDIKSKQYIKEMVFTPDGSEVYLIEHPNIINIFSTKSYERIKKIVIDADYIKEFAFTSDSKYYTMTTDRNYSILYDRKTDSEFRRYKAPEDAQCRIAFSPDGKYVATYNSKENLLRVYEIDGNIKKLSMNLYFNNFDFIKFAPSCNRVAILNYNETTNNESIDLVPYIDKISPLSYKQKLNYTEQFNYRKYFFEFVNMDDRLLLPSPNNPNEFIVYDFVTKRIFQTIKLNPIGSKSSDFYNFKLSSDNMRLFYDDGEFVYSQNIYNQNDVIIYPANLVFNSIIHLPKSDKILIKYLDDYSYMTTNSIDNFKHFSNTNINGIDKNINLNHVLFIENDRILKLKEQNNSISLLLINRLDGSVLDSMFIGKSDNIVLDSCKIIQYRAPFVNIKLAVLPKNAYSPVYEYHIINFDLKYLHYSTSKIDKAFLNFNNQYLICNKTIENSNSLHIINLNNNKEVNSFSNFSEKFIDFIPINNTYKIFIYYQSGKTATFDYRLNDENLVYNFNQTYDSVAFSTDGSTFISYIDTIINSKHNYKFILHKEAYAKPIFLNFTSDYKTNALITNDGSNLILYNKKWARSYKLSNLKIYSNISDVFELRSSNLAFPDLDLGVCFNTKTLDTLFDKYIVNNDIYPVLIKKIELKKKDDSRIVYADKVFNKLLNPNDKLPIRFAYYPDRTNSEQDSLFIYYDNTIAKSSINASANYQLFWKNTIYVTEIPVRLNDTARMIIYPILNPWTSSIKFKPLDNLNIDDGEYFFTNLKNDFELKTRESLNLELYYVPKYNHYAMAVFNLHHNLDTKPEQISLIIHSNKLSSVEDFKQIGDLFVYPNPTIKDYIYIKTDKFERNFNLRIYNLLGEKLIDLNSDACQIFDNVFKLNCSQLANGQYYIICSDDKQQLTANIKILR